MKLNGEQKEDEQELKMTIMKSQLSRNQAETINLKGKSESKGPGYYNP